MTLGDFCKQVEKAIQAERSNVWLEWTLSCVVVNFRCSACLTRGFHKFQHKMDADTVEGLAKVILYMIVADETAHQKNGYCNSPKT